MDKKSVKTKKCRICLGEFIPFQFGQVVCTKNNYQCANELAKQKREKADKKDRKEYRAETRRLKAKIKSKAQWALEAQTAVNRYVRLRDKGNPCISCDKPDNGQHQRHASHLKSVGSNSALRFNLWNIHASCQVCNNHLSGNIGEYIPRVINKIGGEKYDWLQTQNHPVKYDIEYLKRIKRIFAKRCRVLEKRNKA